MRYAQLVLGPAGSGKSTYCSVLQNHGDSVRRTIQVMNLDPAAEQFQYKATSDIRELIELDDVLAAEDLNFGPNGGLVFCMEYLTETSGREWLKEKIGDDDEDYIIFDCPGQIELYTHMNVMNEFAQMLLDWNFQVCVVFILDSHYMIDGAKFLSGSLTALSTMVKLELPQLNILSKMDMLDSHSKKQLEMFLDPEIPALVASDHSLSKFNKKFNKLTRALGKVVEDYSLISFVPLDISKEDSISDVLLQVDMRIQYGEDHDVKTTDYEYQDEGQEDELEEDIIQKLCME